MYNESGKWRCSIISWEEKFPQMCLHNSGCSQYSDSKSTFWAHDSDLYIIKINHIIQKVLMPTLIGSVDYQKYSFQTVLNVDD
jgi:hypothetical protein